MAAHCFVTVEFLLAFDVEPGHSEGVSMRNRNWLAVVVGLAVFTVIMFGMGLFLGWPSETISYLMVVPWMVALWIYHLLGDRRKAAERAERRRRSQSASKNPPPERQRPLD